MTHNDLETYLRRLARPAVALCLIAALLIPALFLGLAAILPLLALALVGLRFHSASRSTGVLPDTPARGVPLVSIFVATYDEPPELVIETLKSLLQIDYPNFEILVLDNNTPLPSVWRPVKQFCATDKRLRFWHISPLKGFKAGALNACLERCHPETEYVLVLDADYQVAPDIIRTALDHCGDERVGLVQFPQAYRHISAENAALAREYRHFFNVYMRHANVCDCVLSTGTVSFIRKQALDAISGWGTASITEDVELGLDLYAAGYRGVFVDKRVGHGLMPTDIDALRKQRLRWVYGNAQVLGRLLQMRGSTLSIRQRLSALATLTAWFDGQLLMVAALFTAVLFGWVTADVRYLWGGGLALVALWLSLIGNGLFFWQIGRAANWSPRERLDSYLVHLGLAWEGNVGWLRYVIGRNLPFQRTNKFLSGNIGKSFSPALWLALSLISCGIFYFTNNELLLAFLTFTAAPAFLTPSIAAAQTRATRHNQQELL